jgi:crotonobetainyl-CoA:carnitine CoA-transferase CaiB-like acyl-CoA transferase
MVGTVQVDTALQDVLVVDLTTNVSGAFAGKLLADLGAQVVIIEPTEGSPFRNDNMFTYFSGGKQSFVPEPEVEFESWCAAADIVLTDGTSRWHELIVNRLRESAIVVDLSPFGRTGPYAEWESSDLVSWAMGGYLYFTGSPDREPIMVPGRQAQLHAGAHGALAALVGLHERERSGRGQIVEVSDLEAVLTAHAWLVSSWAACGISLGRQPVDLIRALDGWVYVMRIVPKPELFVLIERPDLADEDLSVDVPTWHANIPRIFEAVAAWAQHRTVAEIVELGQLLRVAVTPVLDCNGVIADEQLAARDFWERDENCNGGIARDIVYPGQPYKFSRTPSLRRGSPPAIGEHSTEFPRFNHATGLQARVAWLEDEQIGDGQPRVPVAKSDTAPPLDGLRILEITTNWAGPVAGRFLADLGADSIKIEWAIRPATRSLFWVGPNQDLQRQPHHRAMYFNEMNRNKRAVCLDLSKSDGRAAFLDLVKTADVVIENNSARVMPNLGLSYSDLKAVNPQIIMVSMSGYGSYGPHRDWVAYGANIETTSALTSITGYSDGQLSRTTLFYADPVSGNYAAIAIMAALRHRDRTGEAQWIDMSLNECGVTYCAEALIELQTTGLVPPPRANRDNRFAPQGVYRCIGTDNWLALTVRSANEWTAVATLIERPDLANDPVLQTLIGRHDRHDELDAAISQWTSEREQYEVAHALQALNIPAGPVLANWQILADPHIHSREMYKTTVHPVVGAYPTTTWPWRYSRTPARLARPAPLFAQHNREVLEEAGFSTHAVESLYASGTTADQPTLA